MVSQQPEASFDGRLAIEQCLSGWLSVRLPVFPAPLPSMVRAGGLKRTARRDSVLAVVREGEDRDPQSTRHASRGRCGQYVGGPGLCFSPGPFAAGGEVQAFLLGFCASFDSFMNAPFGVFLWLF